MFIGFLGIFFLFGGIAGIVLSFYGSGLDIKINVVTLLHLSFLVLCLASGIGLLMRYAWARVLAAGYFFLGSFSFLVFFHPGVNEFLRALFVLTVTFISRSGEVIDIFQRLPLIIAVLLIGISAVSFLIYRRLQQESCVDEFWRGARHDETVAAKKTNVRVYLAAMIWGILLIVPIAVQSYQYKKVELEKAASEKGRVEQGFIKQIYFSQDGKSLYIASDGYSPEVFSVDLMSGKVTGKDSAIYSMEGPGREHILPDRLTALLSDDHRFFFSRIGGSGIIDTATNEKRVIAAMRKGDIPLGFKGRGRYFLFYRLVYYEPNNREIFGATIEMVDMETDRTVYSTLASRPEWITGEDGVNRLPPAVHGGVFSPARDRFAFFYKGSLHVLTTETGALDIYGQDLAKGSRLFFSAEGDAILVNQGEQSRDAGQPPGFLVHLRDGVMISHALTGRILHFSTATGSVIHADDQATEALSVADFPTRKWRIEAQPRIGAPAVSGDGNTLFLTDFNQLRFTYVDLRRVHAGEPPIRHLLKVKVKMPEGPEGYLDMPSLSADGAFVVINNSPELEVLLTDASGGGPKSVLVTNLAKLPK